MFSRKWCALAFVVLIGCGGDADPGDNQGNNQADAGSDASADAGVDVAPDAGIDAGVDAAADAAPPNQPPLADAGLDQTESKDRRVFLSAALSTDPDGDDLTYAWIQVSGEPVALTTPNELRSSFITPRVAGDLVFEVQVSDGRDSATDQVIVTVTNTPPFANAGLVQTVQAGEVVTLDATQSNDVDGDSLTYSWTQVQGEPVSLSDPTSAQPTLTAPSVFGELVFEVEVSDGSSTSTDRTGVIVENLPPIAEAGPDQSVAKGDAVTLDGTGSTDPEGLPLTYTWTQVDGPETVILSDASAAQPTFTTPTTNGGTFIFELVVNDGASDSVADRTRVITPNDPPVADAGSGGAVNGGEIVFLDGRASADPEGDPFDYQWTQTAGTTVFFGDGDRARAYFKVPEGLSETLSFELTVSNMQGTSTDTVSFQTTAWSGTTADLPVNPFAGFLDPFRFHYSLDVSGNRLAVGGSENGTPDDLQIFDISNPETPVLEAGADVGGSVATIVFDGTYIYTGVEEDLVIYEYDGVAGSLTVASTTPFPGTVSAEFIELEGDTLFVGLFGAGAYSIVAYDVQDRSSPTLLHSQTFGPLNSIAARPGELWVGGLGELRVYDTTSLGTATPTFSDFTDPNADSCSFSTNAMQIVGDYLYAACNTQNELAIFDISTPANPTLIGSQNVNGSGEDVHVVGNKAYVAGASAGVLIFDVTNPASPTLLGSLPTSQNTENARFANGYVFARASNVGFDIIPEAFRTPEFAATLPLGITPAVIAFDSGRLAISANDFYIVDIADISNPQIVTTSSSIGGFGNLEFDFPWVYAGGGNRFRIIDVQVPSMPLPVATVMGNFNVLDIDVEGDRLYGALGDRGVRVFDITNKSAPMSLGNYNPANTSLERVIAEGTTAYAVGSLDGLHVIDFTAPAAAAQLGTVANMGLLVGEFHKSGPFCWIGSGTTSYTRYDVSDPSAPTMTSMLIGIGDVEQLRTNGALAWAAAGSAGLVTVDVSDPSNPIVLEQYSTTTDIDTLALADDDVWFGDGGNLRGVRIDNARLGTQFVTTPAGSTITYPISWQEPVNEADVKCFVSDGTCSVTALDAVNRTATVSWTVPASPGDHEIAVVVGHVATRAYLRDRVSVQ